MKKILLSSALCATSALAYANLDPVSERAGTNSETPSTNLPTTPAGMRALVLGGIPASGVLLIPESTNDRVMAFDAATGALLDANFIPASGTVLNTPIDAVLSPDGSQIWVSDQVNDVVQAFNTVSGAFVATYAPIGGANTAVLDNIRGMELLASGNLLVTVGGGGNINAVAQFAPGGAALANFVAAGAGGIASPFDVYRIPSNAPPLNAGEFLVSSSNGPVIRYSASGSAIAQFAVGGTFAQQILQARNGNILLAVFSPPTNDGVYELRPDGTLLNRMDNPELAGYRGVWELANGNILTTNGNGVHEINRATGALVESKITGVAARYISFVGGGAGAGADLSISAQLTGGTSLGELQRLTLTARNLSATAASGVVVRFATPGFLRLAANTCMLSSNGNERSWSIGALAGSAISVCTVDLSNAGVGASAMTVSIAGNGTDPVLSNNEIRLNLGVNAPAVPLFDQRGLGLLLILLGGLGLFMQTRKRA